MSLRLDLACGPNKTPGCVGIDHYPFEGVDVVRDLRRGLPFSDNTVEAILAKHIIEHFDGEDLLFLIDEMWRVTIPGGDWVVVVPDLSSPNRYKDPTHKTRDWSPDSFDFWKVNDAGEHLIYRGPAYRADAKLEVVATEVNGNRDRFYRIKVIK